MGASVDGPARGEEEVADGLQHGIPKRARAGREASRWWIAAKQQNLAQAAPHTRLLLYYDELLPLAAVAADVIGSAIRSTPRGQYTVRVLRGTVHT